MPEFNAGLLANAIQTALILALLGSIDGLLTSLIADSVTLTQHSPNREFCWARHRKRHRGPDRRPTRCGRNTRDGCQHVEYMIDIAHDQDTDCIVMGLKGAPATTLRALNVLKRVPSERYVDDLDGARETAKQILREREARLLPAHA